MSTPNSVLQTYYSSNLNMKTSLASIILGIDVLRAAAHKVLLNPPGPALQLGTANADITDYSRTNVWAPGGNNTDPRTLQISVFYPVGNAPCAGGYQTAYVPQVVSDFEQSYFKPDGDLAQIDYAAFKSQFHRRCSHAEKDYPVIVFSPGYYRTRLLYGVLAQSVAKAGYIVVTIDHPYDADIVVLESGKVIHGIDDSNFSDISNYTVAGAERVKDLRFLLDRLGDHKFLKKVLPTVPYKLDGSHVGIFGHSMGGAALADLMVTDERVVGGLNMDGSDFPTAATKGLDQPYLLFGSEGHDHFSDDTWNRTWANLRGWHAELNIKGSVHSTFGDLAFLVKTLGLGNSGNESRVVGSIDGGVAMVDERTVVVDFMDWILKGKRRSKLLGGDNEGFPDIYYVTDDCTLGTC